MTVYLVGAGPGDPGLITVRGADLVRRADVVVHDRLIDMALVDLAPPGAERIDVGKRPGRPHRQHDINELLVDRGRRWPTVVRLKGGDPFVFGRGGEEAEALRAAGVPVEVVPGVTSAFAAPAAAGVPVTHRGLATSVTVVTGHVGDAAEPGGVDWASLARAGGTVVVLMGVEHRAAIADALMAGGRSPDTPVAFVHWGTTARQRSLRTTLGAVASVAVDPPTVMVVGAVAGLELGLAERRPLSGMTAVVTRPRHQAADIVAALGDAGAAVVVLPTVAIVDPEDGGRALHAAAAVVDGYDWLVCTSANAVDRVVEAVVDLRRLHGVRIAAVGPATAAALARHHLVADLVAATASGDGLVADLTATGVAGRRVLYPRSASARPTVADGLRALGCTVDDVVAYRSVTPERSSLAPTVLERAGEADVAVVASPSAVEGLVAVLGDGSSDAVPPVVAIGPVTAQAARRLGVTVAAEASDPSPAGLVAAVAMWWGSTPGGARPASGDVRRLGGGG